MKINRINELALTTFASALLGLPASAGILPNGDFSEGATSWEEASGGGSYSFDYPTTGGNLDGYGVIDNSGGGGFGIWIADDGNIMSLDSLGLTAGATHKFSQDMILLSGPKIGGFKIEIYKDGAEIGNSGERFLDAVEGGANWETYSTYVPIAADADGIKVVPLWGADSVVGYDNICVDATPLPTSLVPNGGFEKGPSGSTDWQEDGSDTTWEYPQVGGNPGRYGVMTNGGSIGSFGRWFANNGSRLALEDLELDAGTTVTFLMDMQLLSGTQVGALKIEYFNGAVAIGESSGATTTVADDVSIWQTYEFPVDLPSDTTHIRVLPVVATGSSVGFDNITFTGPPRQTFPLSIALGNILTWEPENPQNLKLVYQPQSSDDEIEWDNFGPAILGESQTSAAITVDAPFYRVEVLENQPESIVLNGGFEVESFDGLECAEQWVCISPSGQVPTRITTDFRSGEASMRLAVQNDANATPNQSEIQQNITESGGFITPGETYEFSFWAKQISTNGTYEQRYRIQWLESGGNEIEVTPFTNFTGVIGVWTEFKIDEVVAPANAETALFQMIVLTGAVPGVDQGGEILIDDVSLATFSPQPFEELPAEITPGLQVTWDAEEDFSYQVQASEIDMDNFVDFGAPIIGTDEETSIGDMLNLDAKFYRVIRTAVE